MKHFKRVLSLALTLVLVLGCLSGLHLPVYAETAYDLWISGQQVTSENKDDVMGDGTVSFDPDTFTLYLNNASLTSGTKSSAVIYNGSGQELIIVVGGENEVGAISAGTPYGIKSDYRDFRIRGSGTLHVSGSYAGVISQTGYVYFDEPTDCTTVLVEGGQYGMRVGSVYLGNAKLTAVSRCSAYDSRENSTAVCKYAAICAYSYAGGEEPNTISVGNLSGGTDSVAELTAVCDAGAAADCWALYAKGSILLAEDELLAQPNGGRIYGTEGESVTVLDSTDTRAVNVSIRPRSLIPYDLESYDLWINGVQVTMQNKDGIPGLSGCSFDAQTNTLYLSGELTLDQSMPDGMPDCAIYSTMPELYIDLASGSTVSSTGMQSGIVTANAGNLHVRGSGALQLGGSSFGIQCDGNVYFDESDTSLQPTLTLNAGQNALLARSVYLWNVDLNASVTGTADAEEEPSDYAAVRAAGDGQSDGILQIGSNETEWKNNATVYAAAPGGCGLYAKSSLDISGVMQVLLPESYLPYNSSHNTIRDAETGSAATTVSLRPGTESIGTTYEIWVGGVQVTVANRNDVLGDGTVRYDPGAHTLYLDGATIRSYYGSSFYGNSHIFFNENATLTLVVSGENVMGAESGSGRSGDYGVNLNKGNLRIIGDGTLRLENITLTGIECNYDGDLYFDDPVNRPTLYVSALRYGIHARNVYIDRAELYINCSGYMSVDSVDNCRAAAIYAERSYDNGGTLRIGKSTGEDNVILEATIGRQQDKFYALYATTTLTITDTEHIVTPEGGGIGNNRTVIDRYGATAGTVRIEPQQAPAQVQSYDLWINGERVSVNNKDDLPGLEGCSFDPATNTLHLTGEIALDRPMVVNSIACAIYSKLPDLYIVLEDDCVASVSGHGNGIFAASGCNVHIRGGGTLQMYDITGAGISCVGGGGKIYFDGQDPDTQPTVEIEAQQNALIANFIYLWNVKLQAVVTSGGLSSGKTPIKAVSYTYYTNVAVYDGGVIEIGSDDPEAIWKNNAVVYATSPYADAILAEYKLYGSTVCSGSLTLSAGERVWTPNNTSIEREVGSLYCYYFKNTTTGGHCSTVYIAPSGEIPDTEIAYELWINGVQVTSENADFLPGMGGSYYDPLENTLYLSGRITANGTTDGKPDAPIYTTMQNLTIVLDFGRTELCSEEHNYGIYATGNLRIIGGGMLTVSNAAREGIHVGGTLTIEDPESAPSVNVYAHQYAIRAGMLNLKACDLNAIVLSTNTAGNDSSVPNAAILADNIAIGSYSAEVYENNVTVYASCDVSGGYAIYAKNSALMLSSYVDVIKPVNHSWSGGHYVLDGNGDPARIVSIAPKTYYIIEIDDSTDGGVIELVDHIDGRAFPGSTVTYRIVPEDGCRRESVTIYYSDEAATSYTLTGDSFVMPSEGVFLTATFYVYGHAVNVENVVGGTAQADCRRADPNTTVTVSATPDTGYRWVGMTVIGESGSEIPTQGNHFTMPDEDVTVTPIFQKINYSISIYDGGNSYGIMTADRSTATIGDTVTLTLNIEPGFQLEYITAEAPLIDQTVTLRRTGETTYQFTMPAASVNIRAGFERATFEIAVAPMEHGAVSVKCSEQETTEASYERTVYLTVSPESGYELKSLTVTRDNDPQTAVNLYREGGISRRYYFYMPASNVTVTAVFGPIGQPITVNVTGSGTVVPNKDVVPAGEQVTLTVTPEDGWALGTLHVFNSGSEEITVSEDYTFTMQSLPATVEAVFVHVDHSYAEPVWTWNGNSAAASFTCTVCGQEETVEATITTQELPGQTDVTATVTFAGEVYTDTKTTYKTWNIYVGGVRITGTNYTDILGDGTVAYDPVTNTLSLTNAQIEVQKISGEAFGIRYNENTNDTTQLPLRIELNGSNTITDAQPDEEVTEVYGLCAYASSPGYVITGTGSLDVTIQADNEAIRYYGIHVRKALTVDGASVTVNVPGTASSVGLDLIYNDSILHLINGASMQISVGSHADTAAMASNRNVACLDVTAGCTFVARADSRAFHERVGDQIERINLTDETKACGVLVSEENDRESAAAWDESTALSSYKYVAIPAIARTVTFAAAEGGTSGMDRETVYDGQTVTLTAAPAAGYTFSHYTVTDALDQTVELATENSFVMPAADVTVTPSFTPIDYTVTVLEAANGTVSVSGDPNRAHVGDTITLTAGPAVGYILQGYTVTDENGQPVALATEDSFIMPACNVTVEAAFTLADYTVQFSTAPGGSASATPNPAHMGDTITLTADAAEGYRFSEYTVTDASGQPVELVTENAFVMPASDATVTPRFAAIDYTISVLPTSNGSVTVSQSTAHIGDAVVFTVTPAEGCALQTLTVYDFSYHTYELTDNTLVMPAANLIVVATFTPAPYSITIAETQHGSVTASQSIAAAGSRITLTVTPESGYVLGGLTVADAEGAALAVMNDQFTMPASNVTVTASFLEANPTVKYFVGNSLTLAGDIGINFYVQLNDVPQDAAKIVFTWGRGLTKTVTFDDLTPDSSLRYKTSVQVAAAEMTDTVTAKLYDAQKLVAEQQYSVAQYARYVLGAKDEVLLPLVENDLTKVGHLRALCKAMLIYGAKSQLQFNYNVYALADQGLAYSLDDVNTLNTTTFPDGFAEACGIRYYGSSLVLDSKTSYRLYFTVTDQQKLDALTVKLGSDKLTYGVRDDYIYFEIPDIAAAYVFKDHTLTFGDISITANAGEYLINVFDSGDQTLQNVVKALYWYSMAAKTYFDVE